MAFFESLGRKVTNRPLLTILVTVLFAFALAPGMVMGGSERNGENLWTPQDTESKRQDAWVKGSFGAGDRMARAYSMNGGANLLTQESLAGLAKLHDGMLAVSADCETGSCDGKKVSYGDVLAKKRASVLSIWADQAPPVGADILADVNDQSKWVSSDGTKLKLSDMLGGVSYDANGKIISAEAFLTKIFLKNIKEDVDSTSTDPATEAWELEFDDYVKDFSHSNLAKSYPSTTKGRGRAGGGAIQDDVKLLSQGYNFLIIFSIIVLSHHKLIHSNGVMAFASIFAVMLSIVSAFGVCGYLGVKTNPVTTTLFLVLLGIGVDDTYVIMGEYTAVKGDPKDRVIQALTKAGTSIAVTSMTDVVAFAVGISSSLPALRDFCVFAAVGILFDFAFQCTFLIAVLTLRAKGTANNRPDWLCCITVDPERTGCCGCSAPVCSRNGQHVCCPCSKAVENGDTHGLTRRALNFITSYTLTPIGRVVVLVATVGMLAVAVTGFPKLKTDFDINWFVPDGHMYQDMFDVQDKYFATSGGPPIYIYTKSGDYAAAHSDGSLAALYKRTLDCSWVDRGVGSWYSSFVADTARSDRAKVSASAFANEVKTFVASPAGKRFANDVKFAIDASGANSVTASRSMVFMKETKSGGEDVESMNAVRDCVSGGPLEAFPFFYAFLYFDGLDVVDGECIQNVLLASLCVFVVSVIMLADIVAASIVLLMIGLVDVCLLGYMAHWGLAFNSVTAVNLVLAVGLAVDYSAHIAHKFLVVTGSGVERARAAVDKIGPSVFNGAFSTFLAVAPLGLSKSYVFQIFFKMWFMIIVFGVYFGVIVLPIVLSLAGRFVGAPHTGRASQIEQASDIKHKVPDVETNSPTSPAQQEMDASDKVKALDAEEVQAEV